mmetsp:Transcript_49077/g.96764  ORF Transcript_49077/g.96764 Transcript_49077/m.96764 type:complete len:140 (+) Transcript_49077:809-1228(+)
MHVFTLCFFVYLQDHVSWRTHDSQSNLSSVHFVWSSLSSAHSPFIQTFRETMPVVTISYHDYSPNSEPTSQSASHCNDEGLGRERKRNVIDRKERHSCLRASRVRIEFFLRSFLCIDREKEKGNVEENCAMGRVRKKKR